MSVKQNLFSQGHALLVGVGTYKNDDRYDVPVTVKDAQMVSAALVDPDVCGYPAEQVALISEGQATVDGIRKSFKALAEQTTKESTVLIFFCSHGAYGSGKEKKWYFTTHDTVFESGEGNEILVNPETALGEKELLDLIRMVPSSKKFIIFNTCHSGNMMQTLGPNNSPRHSKNPSKEFSTSLLDGGKGDVIIAASGTDQLSYFERGASTTIFTQALVEALNGNGVINNNGFISAFNLYSAVHDDVEEKVRFMNGENGGAQHPELTALSVVGSMPIALYRGASLSFNGFKPESSLPVGRNVNGATQAQVTEIVKTYFNEGSQQINIGTVDGNFVAGNQVEGSVYEAGNDIRIDQSQETINTDGGAYVGGAVNIGSGSFTGRDSYSIGNVGKGSTIAQGSGSRAQGAGSVSVGGSNTGNIITGDGNTVGDNNISIGGNVGAGAAIGQGASVQAQNIAGGDINIGADAAATKAVFGKLYADIQAKVSDADMANEAINSIKEIEAQNKKGDSCDEGVIRSKLKMLRLMAPDIWQVAVDTFTSPTKGISTVIQKVAVKANAENQPL